VGHGDDLLIARHALAELELDKRGARGGRFAAACGLIYLPVNSA
jgi:hypothetical protein